MDKIFIRHEPIRPYLYLFGIVFLWLGIDSLLKNEMDALNTIIIIFLISEGVLFFLHILFRKKVIGEISDDGVKIIDEVFIRWDDIKLWDYYPSGKFSRNYIKIETKTNEEYFLRGISCLKTVKYFKLYVVDKQRKGTLKEFFIIITIIIVVFIVAYFLCK